MTPSTPAPAEGEYLTRRCLICANINPCREHSAEAQRIELARNDAAIAMIRAARPTLPVAGEVAEVIERLREMAAKMERGIVTIWPHPLNEAADLLSRLSASQGSFGAESGWRGIESAPRDGTWFLACATKKGWGASRIVRFAYPDDRLPIHGEGAVWPSAPTHWMPLPPPPAPDGPVSRNGEEG